MTMLGKWRAARLSALTRRSFAAALDRQERPRAVPIAVADPKRDMALFGHRSENGDIVILPRQSASAQLPLAKAELLVLRRTGSPALPASAPLRALDLQRFPSTAMAL